MLAATAGLTVSASGCLRLRDIVTPDNIDQLSVSITTIPADANRQNIQIARRLEKNFEAVGVDVSLDIRSKIDFRRTVLYDHEFDICIGRHPGGTDPDFLYEALYSRYADESGWQNPFGFTNLDLDELLEEQRIAEGKERREAVTAVLEEIATQQPFVPICLPEEHRVVRTDRFDGWNEGHPATRHGYLGLEPSAGVDTLRVGHTDARPTENLNPIAPDYRHNGMVTDLLYDSIATQNGAGDLQPWLAESYDWDDGAFDIRLREGCEFHDGEPVTAKDVVFTYRFLQDTSLGSHDTPSPTPRYRGHVDAVDVDSISIGTDTHRIELPIETTRAVAERALLVPILPAHIWREYATETAGPGGPSVAQGTTEGIVTNNIPPIGSGPFQFESRTEGDQLLLERFESHFTRRSGVGLPSLTVGECPIVIHPSSTTVAEVVQDDGADITSLPLDAHAIDGVDESGDVELLESPSWSFYFLGFNARKAPFSNPLFRQIVAQLVDKETLCNEVFHGHARPMVTPVTDEWVPESLEWDGRDPKMPFLGTDGEVDVEAAKIAFEEAGFRYDDQGRLRTRQ